ncbi:MAG: hypothetical protein NVS9B4_10720 [Candidatus Acidiferrum sp.]
MKFLGKLFLLLLIAGGAVAAWLWYSLEQPYQGYRAPEGVFVDVPHGASTRVVARLLKKNGIVRSAWTFELYSRRHRLRRMQAGEYFFDRPLAGREVFWKLARGEVYEQPFTVREGETIFDIGRDLQAAKLMKAEEFLEAAKDASSIQDLAPRAKTLEGFLFPATYHLPRHPVAATLTAEMVRKFREEWSTITGARETAAAPGGASTAVGGDDSAAASAPALDGRPVASIVTLASLVERETPKPEERPLVAGVFENRLRRNMPLQCDPTVIYALEKMQKYRGTLTGSDLHLDSPYNTYQHAGLPPGPIGNPGEASLRAALQPAQTDYLYFVANTQGGHFFSATLKDHNQNVSKYRRLLAGGPADPPVEETTVPPHAPRTRGQKTKQGQRDKHLQGHTRQLHRGAER